VIVLVQDAQIKGQQRDHDADEDEPDPGRLAQEVDRQEREQGVHHQVLRECGGDGADAAQATHRTEQRHIAPLVAEMPGIGSDPEHRCSHDSKKENDRVHVL